MEKKHDCCVHVCERVFAKWTRLEILMRLLARFRAKTQCYITPYPPAWNEVERNALTTNPTRVRISRKIYIQSSAQKEIWFSSISHTHTFLFAFFYACADFPLANLFYSRSILYLHRYPRYCAVNTHRMRPAEEMKMATTPMVAATFAGARKNLYY